MVLEDLDRYKQMKLDHQLNPYTRINSKWIKYLNISRDTLEVLEENISRKISNILCSNIFADTSTMVKDRKEIINKWDYTKLKSFCMTKETIIWENIFAKDTLSKA